MLLKSSFNLNGQEADDKVLKLKHVSLEDRGVYECKATNGFGSVTVAFYVYIYREIFILSSSIQNIFSYLQVVF